MSWEFCFFFLLKIFVFNNTNEICGYCCCCVYYVYIWWMKEWKKRMKFPFANHPGIHGFLLSLFFRLLAFVIVRKVNRKYTLQKILCGNTHDQLTIKVFSFSIFIYIDMYIYIFGVLYVDFVVYSTHKITVKAHQRK